MPVQPKRVLLIVGGGVAAYKALALTRLLRKAGVLVRPILTRAGEKFITPLSLGALAEDKVYGDLFSLTDEAEMGHIELSRSADLIVVVPATADLMARAALGLADDLASTTLLATDTAILMAPAMNVRMWLHPATQANVATLKARGVTMVGPDEGAMACGEFGPGRLAEPPAILDAVLAALAGPAGRPLAGKRILVTAGPTVEPIDPVRVLTNRSSGKQGYAVAGALQVLGAEVTLVSGHTALSAPPGVNRVDVETAVEMLAACRAALPVDAAVCVAAVADWRPASVQARKPAKDEQPSALELVQNPDILATLAQIGSRRPALVVGFAAETHDVEAHARAKRARKGCDWIVANDVSHAGTMGGDENAVLLLTGDGAETWPRASKSEIARRLAERIAAALIALDPAYKPPESGKNIRMKPVIAIRRLPHAEGLPLPAYETPGAAGMDLRAALPQGETLIIKPGARDRAPTGLCIAVPMGFEAQVRPRSGLAAKAGVTVLNSPGTIDSDYRGEVQVILINLGPEDFVIRRGDRIAQMVIAPVAAASWDLVENLDQTARGAGGFGSTGHG